MIKKIGIFVALAALSFGGSFALSVLLGGPETPRTATELPTDDTARAGFGGGLAAGLAEIQKMLPEEKQLQSLVADLKLREKDLQMRESQLQADQRRMETLRKDLGAELEQLEKKRLALAATLRKVKEAQAALVETRIRFEKQERARLQHIAKTMERMSSKAADAAAIITAMCANGQRDDAVKVLYLMTPSRLYKVLAEIPDRKLTAQLTEAMKRVQTEE